MIIENDSERDYLRALLKSPQFGLPEYTVDQIAQRRVGRALAETSAAFASHVVVPIPVLNASCE